MSNIIKVGVTQPLDGAVSQDSDTTCSKLNEYIFINFFNLQIFDWSNNLINWIDLKFFCSMFYPNI